MLAFDEATHTYTWHGRQVVNVTRVLDSMLNTYEHVPRATLEVARQQGVAVHRTIELHLKGNLGHCPEWLAPYVEAWDSFAQHTPFVLEASEQRLYNSDHDYAGTADLFGWLDMRRLGVQHVVIDLKRSFMAGAAIGLQTAAYAGAYNRAKHLADPQERIQARFALRLRPDHTPPFELKQFADADDYATFCAMLKTYRWMTVHGHRNSRRVENTPS